MAPSPERPSRFASSAARLVHAANGDVTLTVNGAVSGSVAPNSPLTTAVSDAPGGAFAASVNASGSDRVSPAARLTEAGNPPTVSPGLAVAVSVTGVAVLPSESSVSVAATVAPGSAVAPSGRIRSSSALAAGVVIVTVRSAKTALLVRLRTWLLNDRDEPGGGSAPPVVRHTLTSPEAPGASRRSGLE